MSSSNNSNNSSEDAIRTLRSLCLSGSDVSGALSADGKTLRIGNSTFDATEKCTLLLTDSENKSVATATYSLASLYLQIVDPKGSLVQYRKACTDVGVEDPVKVLDKSSVLSHFYGDATTTNNVAADDEMEIDDDDSDNEDPQPAAHKTHTLPVETDKQRRERHRLRDSERRKEKRRSDSHTAKETHKRHSDNHRDAKHRHDKKKPGAHTSKAPMTNEQLMRNLNTVVDKRMPVHDNSSNKGEVQRQQETLKEPTALAQLLLSSSEPPALEEERLAIQACLSSRGYEVGTITQQMLDADKPFVQQITALERPVGDSASVLRACNTTVTSSGVNLLGTPAAKRDFTRVLDLYNDVLKAEEKQRRMSKSIDSKRSKTDTTTTNNNTAVTGVDKRGAMGKPIIIVPNAMTSPITMLNAHEFFVNSTFVPRDVMLQRKEQKKSTILTVKRRTTIRGQQQVEEMEYEIMDNPTTKLMNSKLDWDRIVAVIPQGAAWQFKGWNYSSPVDIFSRCFGFYVGMEGTPIPKEVMGWNVKRGILNRDKRGLNSVTFASFWNGLEEWMSVHKPDFLPRAEH